MKTAQQIFAFALVAIICTYVGHVTAQGAGVSVPKGSIVLWKGNSCLEATASLSEKYTVIGCKL